MTWKFHEIDEGGLDKVSGSISDFLIKRGPNYASAVTAKTVITDQAGGAVRGGVFFWDAAILPELIYTEPEFDRWSASFHASSDKKEYKQLYDFILEKLNSFDLPTAIASHVSMTNYGGGTPTITISYPSHTVSPEQQRDLMAKYAPKVWLAKGEEFHPSSVDWSMPYLNKTPIDGRPWLITRENMPTPGTELDYFKGQQNLSDVPVYAYWADKFDGDVDLIYFMYYPYNLGKKVAGKTYGDHVGDWEHVTVRLRWTDLDGDTHLRPIMFAYEAHGDTTKVEWPSAGEASGDIAFEGDHPIVYAAYGSHGLWASAGEHVYKDLPVFELSDDTSKGTAWDTWNNLVLLDYTTKSPISPTETYPAWMGYNGDGWRSQNPGGVYRWGNEHAGVAIKPLGIYERSDGPTGPVDKPVWGRALK